MAAPTWTTQAPSPSTDSMSAYCGSSVVENDTSATRQLCSSRFPCSTARACSTMLAPSEDTPTDAGVRTAAWVVTRAKTTARRDRERPHVAKAPLCPLSRLRPRARDDLGVLERGDDRRAVRRDRRVEPERRAAGDLPGRADELGGHHEGPGRLRRAGPDPGAFGLDQEAGDIDPGVVVEADHDGPAARLGRDRLDGVRQGRVGVRGAHGRAGGEHGT